MQFGRKEEIPNRSPKSHSGRLKKSRINILIFFKENKFYGNKTCCQQNVRSVIQAYSSKLAVHERQLEIASRLS